MKSLVEFIRESNEDEVKKCEEQYDDKMLELHKMCVKYDYDPSDNKLFNEIDKKKDDIVKFLEDGDFDERVKYKFEFYKALVDKDVASLKKIFDDQKVWGWYFNPYITSAGEFKVDNRKGLFGMAEAIFLLYSAAKEIGLNRLGNKMADYEFDDIIKKIS